jgi:hypothetical protein
LPEYGRFQPPAALGKMDVGPEKAYIRFPFFPPIAGSFMPAQFNSLGISFQYPDNWTLDDSDALLGRRSVTVFSPGGAFWSIALQPDTAEPKTAAATVVDTLKQEYQGLEAELVEESVAGHDLVGYDLAFYCLDLTNTAHIRALRIAHTTYTIYCQAEDREYQQVKRVFEAMTLTLLNSLKDLRCAE